MIYVQEVDRFVNQAVTGTPLLGAASANPLLLGALLTSVVLLIALLALPTYNAEGGQLTWRDTGGHFLRGFLYAIGPVLLLVHVYGTGVAALTEHVVGGMGIQDFVSAGGGGTLAPPPRTGENGGYQPDYAMRGEEHQPQPPLPGSRHTHPANHTMTELENAMR